MLTWPVGSRGRRQHSEMSAGTGGNEMDIAAVYKEMIIIIVIIIRVIIRNLETKNAQGGEVPVVCLP